MATASFFKVFKAVKEEIPSKGPEFRGANEQMKFSVKSKSLVAQNDYQNPDTRTNKK